MRDIDLDQLRAESAEAAARGIDCLNDPKIVSQIENLSLGVINLSNDMKISGITAAEISSFMGGTFARIMYEINKLERL